MQIRIMNPEANKGKAQNIGKFLFLIFIPNYQDVFSKPFVKKKIWLLPIDLQIFANLICKNGTPVRKKFHLSFLTHCYKNSRLVPSSSDLRELFIRFGHQWGPIEQKRKEKEPSHWRISCTDEIELLSLMIV